jgi:hypothetical protein
VGHADGGAHAGLGVEDAVDVVGVQAVGGRVRPDFEVRRADDDALHTGAVLCVLDRVGERLSRDAAEDRIHAAAEVDFENVRDRLSLADVLLNVIVLGGRAVTPSEKPVGANNQPRHAHATDVRTRELFHDLSFSPVLVGGSLNLPESVPIVYTEF